MIDISSKYKNKSVAVLGYGVTGKSVVKALESANADIYILDDNKIDSPYFDREIDWRKIDALVVSPGIHTSWNMHPIVAEARKFSIPVTNDIAMFQRCMDLSKIIGVTGTNGKSTTTAIIHHVLNQKFPAELGGNYGVPALTLSENAKAFVLEISSYQLETIDMFPASVSILLNITPDHLTRHGGLAGYIATKQKIFAFPNCRDSLAVIGVDDKYCRDVYEYLLREKAYSAIPISGQYVPEAGIGWDGDEMVDNCEGANVRICSSHPLLDGAHNRQNIAAAYAACCRSRFGILKSEFDEALRSFKGLEHRQEFVRDLNGVKYINDSKATNADAVEQALKRFSNVIWILGGRPKEGGIKSLEPYFDRIKYAFLIGEAAEEFHHFLNQNYVGNEIVGDLEKAVQRARNISEAGDIVLLSPACASFDQFKDFEERGRQFKEMVLKLC